MDDTDFFSTETIAVPIGFRLFAIEDNRKDIRLSGNGALNKFMSFRVSIALV